MAHSKYRAPLALALALLFSLSIARAAEDAPVLLTIEGNLIGLSEPFAGNFLNAQDALAFVHQYHNRLPSDQQQRAEKLHGQILDLVPGFEVAYAAADSAEITHVMSEIDMRLARLQELYSQEFTRELGMLMHRAYQAILPAFGDD